MRFDSLRVQSQRKRVPRRAQRYPVHWAIKEINGKPAKDAWMVDVSCRGARLDTTTALAPNLPIIVTVILPEGDTEMVVKGRVVWMRPVFTSHGRFHQGIQFQVMNWDLERLAKMEGPK